MIKTDKELKALSIAELQQLRKMHWNMVKRVDALVKYREEFVE